MKKVVLTSLLAATVAAPFASVTFAQQTAGGIQMSQEEYKAYNDANTMGCTDAASCSAKAAAFESYLKAYPNSAVKVDVLSQILYADSQSDPAKAIDAADRLLQADPTNLRALTFEVYLRRAAADKLTDDAAKAAAYDVVAGYAQKALDDTAPSKASGMTQDDFTKMKTATIGAFYNAIASDDVLNHKNDAAEDVLKKELHAVPLADTQDPNKQLPDTLLLAQAYYTQKPPDYLNCAWYGTRALAFAPEAFGTANIKPMANYCYKKYHGSMDGYDAFMAATKTSLDQPSTVVVTPAPKPEDIVAQTIASTPDLATLAPGDREFILQYGGAKDPKSDAGKTYADETFDAVKGKAVELPDVLVVSATPDTITVAVSDDAKQANPPVADYTFKMKPPAPPKPGVRAKPVVTPKAGDKVTITGVYDSYTANPVMINMTDGELVLPKPAAPVHRTPARPTHK